MKKLKIISIVLFAILYSANTYAYTKDDFVITIKTTKPNEDFIIYNKRGFTYNYNVDCNNNGTYNFKGQTAKTTCTYPKAGIHTIAIVDNIGDKTGYPVINFGVNYPYSNIKKLQTVEQWGTSKWKTMYSAFQGASNLTTTSSKDQPDLSNVTDMGYMFYFASSANPDVSKWDVSNVTDMGAMFSLTTKANPDVSKWDVSNVTDMDSMFYNATKANPDVSKWDVSKVTDMDSMFSGATKANPDVSKWDVSNVTNMDSMFYNATKANPDVSKWDVSNVTNMDSMFYNATKANPDVSKWDVSNVTDMDSMFHDTTKANPDVSKWDVSNVTDMYAMFSGAISANPDVSKWDVSKVTDMWSMFHDTTKANPDVSKWDVSNVTYMSSMFYNAKKANPDVSKWDVSNVTNMDDMFSGAISANPDVSKWDVSNVTNMRSMFHDTTKANPDVSKWDVSKVTDMYAMFSGAISANPDVSKWDVSNVTNMRSMFHDTTKANPDVSKWDVSKVTDMYAMFSGAISANPDVSKWDVSNVTDMSSMFHDTTKANPDVSKWDVSNVTDMSSMFHDTTKANPDVSKWDVSKVTDMDSMFSGATKANPDVSKWDVSNVTDMGAMFSGAISANPDVSAWDISKVDIKNKSSYWKNFWGMQYIFDNSAMSITNYDKLLNSWSKKTLQKNLDFGVYGLTYCKASQARDKIIKDYNWTFRGDKKCQKKDTTPPIKPIVKPTDGSIIEGTGEVGTKITVIVANQVRCTTTVNTSGKYKCILNPKAKPGETIIVKSTDKAGNESTTTIVVKIIDKIPPTIILKGSASYVATAGLLYTDPGAICKDNIDSEKSATATGKVNAAVLGTYKITYNCSDKAGNKATPIVRTIRIVPTNRLKLDIDLPTKTVSSGMTKNFIVSKITTKNIPKGLFAKYSLVSGQGDEDNQKFKIEGDYLKLNFNADFENPQDKGAIPKNNSYSIRIKSKVNNSEISESFLIQVLPGNIILNDKYKCKGYGWSSNIGWLSLNCANTGSCKYIDYGTSYNNQGDLTGFAWNSSLGWLNNNASGLSNPSKFVGNNLTGFSRFDAGIAKSNDGWGGLLKFNNSKSSPTFGVKKTQSGYLSGYAWGGNVVGWLNFPKKAKAQCLNMLVSFTTGQEKGLTLNTKLNPSEGLVLKWKTENAVSCKALNGDNTTWKDKVNKSVSVSGAWQTETIKNLTENKNFTLECKDSFGNKQTRNLFIFVKPPKPEINFWSTKENIPYNTKAELNWEVKNVSECKATGSWTGVKNITVGKHKELSKKLKDYPNYTFSLQCKSKYPAEYGLDWFKQDVVVDIAKLEVGITAKRNPVPFNYPIELELSSEFAKQCERNFIYIKGQKPLKPDLAGNSFSKSSYAVAPTYVEKWKSENVKESSTYKFKLICLGQFGQKEEKELLLKVGNVPTYIET